MKIILITFIFITSLFGTETVWGDDFEKALIQAKKEQKDIYMLLTSVNCKWCRKFENTTLKDNRVMDRLENQYILLHLDRDLDDIPERFNAKRVPNHYFLNYKGETIYTFLGYWDKDDFSSYLDDVDKIDKKEKR